MRHPLLLAIGLAWAAAAAFAAADDRSQIAQERRILIARFEAEEQACRQRFAVTACVDEVHARRRQALGPLLVDSAGNSHRAELNVEKLWNPFLAGRGKLGLVEFRALRMQHTPERATALACLLRSMVAMLAGADDALPLIDWDVNCTSALPCRSTSSRISTRC